MAAPLEECSWPIDLERYGIVYVRARVWTDKLGDTAGSGAENAAPAPVDEKDRLGRFTCGVRITSPRLGMLPLLLERDVCQPDWDTSLAMLHISVVRPEYCLEMVPSRGCDACDSSSEYLLEGIDETIGAVVDGPFLLLWGKAWSMQWPPNSASSRGIRKAGGHCRMLQLCHRISVGEEVRPPGGRSRSVRGSHVAGLILAGFNTQYRSDRQDSR